MTSDDRVVEQIHEKIKKERDIIKGAQAMRASSNPQVQAVLDAQIKEANKNLIYLQERLNDLQVRRGMETMNMNSQGQRTNRGGQYQQAGNQYGGPVPSNSQYPQGGYGDPGYGGYQQQLGAGTGMMPPSGPYGPPAPGSNMPKARPNYSRLDLIKADTRYLGPRFQLMLSQLAFKLSIEKQYKEGIEKLIRLYSIDGDKRSKMDASSKLMESNQKIMLLSQALRRYEDLNVDIDMGGDADDSSINQPQGRKPLSGQLILRIYGVRDVNHVLTGRFSRGPETYVSVKVEDTIKARTKTTKNDKWTDEVHQIDIDKANEIELTVYDKSNQGASPVGMLWIRIADIVEEMRRKKIETELNSSQWVTAEQMDKGQGSGSGGSGGFGPPPSQHGNIRPPPTGREAPGSTGESHDSAAIDSWFALEPSGAIRLSLHFTKLNRGKANIDLGLGRKGAVRQKKEEVQEQYGHKFVLQQFYSIMRCALCGDFLKYAAGMQCEDCKYLCHQKCFNKVVTKCISKSNAETDPDEEKLNHRIPHRFDAFANLSANWCCHCGYMLPFGRKNAKRCNECDLTVHANCAHLVPDFCGMSMLRANEILSQIRGIPKKPLPNISHGKGVLAARTLRGDRPPGQSPLSTGQTPEQDAQTRPPIQDRRSYGQEQSYDIQPKLSTGPTSIAAQNAASLAAGTVPPQSRADRPGLPPRGPSLDAAQAAAAALTGKRMSQGQAPSATYMPSSPPDYRLTDPRQDDRQKVQQQPQPQQQAYDPSAYARFDGYTQQPQQPAAQGQYQQQQQYGQQNQQQGYGQPQQQQAAAQKQQQQQQRQAVAHQQKRVGLEHFNFLAVLGKGNFGKVMLAETKATKKLYAIKVLKKEFIIENDEVESTKSEKRVFLIANKERHPFLLNLHACFQTETRVYFVMEYISGGDLMLHIQRGQFGLKRAQFYAAEVCLALKYFHENGVIYRDLKLDNILLTLDGHIKIADYGLCKEDMWYGSATSTFCGTPEFMAPEILLDKKYGRAVDWWAFGVLIYQMLLQQSPFRGEDEDEIYDAILADEPLYPIHMPRDSVSILQKLLTREPELRLGSGPTDAQEIMSHAFFRNINWEEIRNLKVEPPFKPSIKSATDTSNFDSEFTSVTPVLTPVQSVLTQAMQEEFRGFSYSADFI